MPEAAQEVGVDERMPWLRPGDLDAEQRALYDVFVGGPRQTQAQFFPVADADGVLSGPYNAMLLAPGVGSAMERLGRAVRYETRLPGRVRELAILTVAHLTESPTEWHAHAGLAAAEGVPAATIESLHSGEPMLDDADRVVHAFAVALLVDHRVPDDVFTAVTDAYGRPGALELIATIGYYQLVAHLNNAFEIGPRR